MIEHPHHVLANARAAIDLLASRGHLSPSAIAEAMGIPRGTAYRLVGALNAINFTEQLPGGEVGLNRRWLGLADAAAAALVEWVDIRPTLADLAMKTGHTAFLTVPRGDLAVCVDSVLGYGSGVWVIRRGMTFPLNAGPGRQFLALRDMGDLLKKNLFAPITDKTLVSAKDLDADTQLTTSRGFVVADEDVVEGMALVGLPVFDGHSLIRGCVALGGQRASIVGEEEHLAGILRPAAAHLEESLTRPG